MVISEGMTVREFAEKLGLKVRDLIRVLFDRGIVANINHVIEPELGVKLAGMFGLDAEQLTELGFLAPVVTLEMKYKRPLRYAEEARVLTTLRPSETATLEFACRIVGADGTEAAAGKTVHALTDLEGVLQYRFTPAVAERLARLVAHLEG